MHAFVQLSSTLEIDELIIVLMHGFENPLTISRVRSVDALIEIIISISNSFEVFDKTDLIASSRYFSPLKDGITIETSFLFSF
jgi:hypothetical protein